MAQASSALLSGVIADLYEAALEPSQWTRLLPSIASLFDSQQVAYNVLDGSGRKVPFIAAHGLGTHDFELFRAFAATTTVPQWYQTASADRPLLRSAVLPDSEFSRSSYYNEVIRPSGSFYALLGPVSRGEVHHIDLIVARDRVSQDYDAEHLATMQIVTSHLGRAMELSRKLAMGRSLLSAFSYLPFGIFFVDPHLRVVEMNGAAETIVTHQGPLSVKHGVLSIKDAENQAALHHLVIDACSVRNGIAPGTGGDLLIRSKRWGIDADFAISVAPLIDPHGKLSFVGPNAVIFVRKISIELPADFNEQASTFFDLTPKEAFLAASLASGMTLKEAAADANIRINTARSYLNSIFVKTGTHQQSQLVALLKSAQVMARSSSGR